MMDVRIKLGESEQFPGKQHQVMLLRMCNNLIGKCIWNPDTESLIFMNEDGSEEIHWLEVCFLHLPKALATSNNRAHDIACRIGMHIQGFYYKPKHVVDYLYYEYQEQTIWMKRN